MTPARRRDGTSMQWHIAPRAAALFDAVPDIAWSAPANERSMTRVKTGAGRSVWRIDTAAGGMIAKVFTVPRGVHAIKTLMRGRPGIREFRAACYGLDHDLPVIRPVAWGRAAAGSGPCVFLSLEVAGARPLQEVWHGADARARRTLIVAVATMLARLHGCGFRPVDVHAGNILIEPAGGAILVDLHGATWGRRVTPLRGQSNLAELNQWFQRHASRAERLRCLEAYLAITHRTADVRVWTAAIAALTRRRGRQLALKRDRRIFGDNRYVGRIELPDGWRACVFLTARRSDATVPLTREGWSIALEPLLAGPGRQAPTRLAVDGRSFDVAIDRESYQPARLRRRWRDAFARLNRHEAEAQPLALLERRHHGHLEESILIVEQRKEPPCAPTTV